MYGVVLWSDPSVRKAVFWCEDHGDLAFYDGSGETASAEMGFEAGDLVQFALDELSDVRMAAEPRLVSEDEHPGLTQAMKPPVRGDGSASGEESRDGPGAGTILFLNGLRTLAL